MIDYYSLILENDYNKPNEKEKILTRIKMGKEYYMVIDFGFLQIKHLLSTNFPRPSYAYQVLKFLDLDKRIDCRFEIDVTQIPAKQKEEIIQLSNEVYLCPNKQTTFKLIRQLIRTKLSVSGEKDIIITSEKQYLYNYRKLLTQLKEMK